MSSWVVATAIMGAAAVGPYVFAQSPSIAQDVQAPKWAEQAVRVVTGSGSHIGVSLRDLNEDDQKGAKAGSGVVVESVETDSPAAKAGLKANDIVVEFDGERVRSSRQFARLVQETVPNRSVPIVAMRDGQRVSMTVQPRDGDAFRYFNGMEFPFPKAAVIAPVPKAAPMVNFFVAGGQLGVNVSELSTQLAEYFGTKDGVLVTSVNENSVAGKAGVRAGDVITSLDGGTIDDTAALRRRAQRLEPGDEFTLGIVRDRKPMTLKGKVESPRRTTGRVIL